jgi:hypothetical protein
MPDYGNMLGVFPERMQAYEVFNMEPRTGGGYGPRYNIRQVTGYMSWRKGGKGAVQGGLRTENERATFWEQCDLVTGKSSMNEFDYVDADGKILLAFEGDDFSKEGGLVRWSMQMVSGLDGRQHTNKQVDEAIYRDY